MHIAPVQLFTATINQSVTDASHAIADSGAVPATATGICIVLGFVIAHNSWQYCLRKHVSDFVGKYSERDADVVICRVCEEICQTGRCR